MKMHPLLLAAGLLALVPVSALAKIERVVEKTFAVESGGTLTVETQGGNIKVESAGDSQVKVVAKQTIRANSEREADEILERLKLTIEQNAEGVAAIAKLEKRGWGRNPVQVDFTVTVPVNYHVSLRTSGGDVRVGDLQGKVRARTSGGNVSLGRIGGEVDAGTSGGDISLVESGGAVKLGTSGGNIRVGRAAGHADLDTSGGDIEIKSVEGYVRADTSGGNVTAAIRGALKSDCVLSTSGGDVRATVDKAAAFNLDASTSGGEVRAEGVTITIEGGAIGKNKLSGRVNGGGSLLRMTSSGGNIVLQTR